MKFVKATFSSNEPVFAESIEKNFDTNFKLKVELS